MSASTRHQLIYTASGDPAKPLLIMIHGWLSHRGVWRTTLPALQDRFYCVAVDLLGFGDNEKPADADYSIAAQAQRIVTLADELGYHKFSLLGHSMGGQISTHIAAITAPERVEHLIVVGGVVTGRLTRFVKYVNLPNIYWGYAMPAIYDLARTWIENRWYANLMFHSWFYDMNEIPFADWQLDRQMACQRALAKSAIPAYRSLRQTDLTPFLENVRAKTLVVFGEYDGTVPVEQAHLLKRHVSQSELVLHKNCGHFPMFEKTEAYLEALNTFFDGKPIS